ncbi:MAG: alkaline phosphatase family protein [Desulfobacteraceae bacterium]|jgi:2,3-bisphosphoglycerate-independent phosphoglycerate mutase
MKILQILLDGLGDRAYKELGYKTPLQAAHTPNLDYLAGIGSNGIFHASIPGECLPSEIAHYLMFGYERDDFPGRGLLEAVGDNVTFQDDDILCLSHLADISFDNGVPILIKGRDEITGDKEILGKLFRNISKYKTRGITFRLVQTRRNDATLIMSGKVSPYISDSDPIVKGNPIASIELVENNPEPEMAENTAGALNEYLCYCHKILSSQKHKANFLVTQRCGRRRVQKSFEKIWGLKGLLMASASIYTGLANEIGLDYITVKDSKNPGKDLSERINIALKDKEHDFFHVHTKAPDEAAHKGTPEHKKVIITELDKCFTGLIKEINKRDDLLVAITADHSTPSDSPLIHSGEPVPIMITGPNVRRDNVDTFDEINAANGCLGFLRGKELILMLLNYADRSMLTSHQLGSEKRVYYPGQYPVFNIRSKLKAQSSKGKR